MLHLSWAFLDKSCWKWSKHMLVSLKMKRKHYGYEIHLEKATILFLLASFPSRKFLRLRCQAPARLDVLLSWPRRTVYLDAGAFAFVCEWTTLISLEQGLYGANATKKGKHILARRPKALVNFFPKISILWTFGQYKQLHVTVPLGFKLDFYLLDILCF